VGERPSGAIVFIRIDRVLDDQTERVERNGRGSIRRNQVLPPRLGSLRRRTRTQANNNNAKLPVTANISNFEKSMQRRSADATVLGQAPWSWAGSTGRRLLEFASQPFELLHQIRLLALARNQFHGLLVVLERLFLLVEQQVRISEVL
jgi:hypothetical protein